MLPSTSKLPTRTGNAWVVGGDEREDVAGRHGLLSLRRHDPNHKREGE